MSTRINFAQSWACRAQPVDCCKRCDPGFVSVFERLDLSRVVRLGVGVHGRQVCKGIPGISERFLALLLFYLVVGGDVRVRPSAVVIVDGLRAFFLSWCV